MSFLEVDNVIDRLEKNMIRDYLISADLKSISKGIFNKRRRMVVILVNTLNVIFFVKSTIGFLSGSKSSLHLYTLNAFYGYGYLGRLWHGVFMCGSLAVIAHASVFFINEKRGTLTPVTQLREMYKKLKDPSPQETASFLLFLKFAIYVREMGFLTIWVPMILFRGVGAVFTAYKFNSLPFLLTFIPVLLVFMIVQQYCPQIHAYTHLLIAQSTTYFKLRLSRVEKSLGSVILAVRTETLKSQRKEQQTTLMRTVNQQLVHLEEILNEIKDHNECIKYWLRDELLITGGLLTYFFVSTLGDIPWYYKLSTVVTVVSWTGPLFPSFINSAQLHVRIMSMAKLLHSCQNHLWVPGKFEARSKSAPDRYQKVISPQEVIKTKHQVMRMIHRVSSPYLRIGYTEGNGESFSPSSNSEFISTVLFTSLMFLKSKSSAVKDLLSF